MAMKHRDYSEAISEALKTNTFLREIRLGKCTLDNNDAKLLAAAIAVNQSVEVLSLEQNKISNEGASAIAEGLRTNIRLVELNILGQPQAFGDACLESFVQMFGYNVTLLKIIWRLESRKAFTLNGLLVRNNTIKKFLAEGKDVGHLVPPMCHIAELRALVPKEATKAALSRDSAIVKSREYATVATQAPDERKKSPRPAVTEEAAPAGGDAATGESKAQEQQEAAPTPDEPQEAEAPAQPEPEKQEQAAAVPEPEPEQQQQQPETAPAKEEPAAAVVESAAPKMTPEQRRQALEERNKAVEARAAELLQQKLANVTEKCVDCDEINAAGYEYCNLCGAARSAPPLDMAALTEEYRAQALAQAQQELPEPEQEEGVAQPAAGEKAAVPDWWELRPTQNGRLLDDNHTLEHNGGEAGAKACISVGTVGFESGVLEFTVLSSGKPNVMVGVSMVETVDQTDATKNKDRFAVSMFNGKVFAPNGVSKPYLVVKDEVTEVLVRCDLDKHTISFAFNGAPLCEPAFSDLPSGVKYFPYFSLGKECSISVV